MNPQPYHRWRSHPWHGLDVGPSPPGLVNAFIELTPFDWMKYELDKITGYLIVDRPQETSSQPPMLYGFVPRTYCGSRVGQLMAGAAGGDTDPLDICVLSERPIVKAEVIVRARVIGGLPMIDDGDADDKIIAVLQEDQVWNHLEDVAQLPPALLDRLAHYFSTYKALPGNVAPISIGKAYGRAHALEVVEASMQDYWEMYGEAAGD